MEIWIYATDDFYGEKDFYPVGVITIMFIVTRVSGVLVVIYMMKKIRDNRDKIQIAQISFKTVMLGLIIYQYVEADQMRAHNHLSKLWT